MDLIAFKDALSASEMPASLPVYLQALWQDANGNWEEAHRLIQDMGDKKAAWIHAYLHRKEGDVSNADYWYHKAGKTSPSVSLHEEWEDIACAIL